VGCSGALLLSGLMSKMLYGVRPTDPVTFAGVLVVLGCAALIATLVPARCRGLERFSEIDLFGIFRKNIGGI